MLSLWQDEDDHLDGSDDRPPWWRRASIIMHIIAFLLAIVLFFAGLCTQFLVPQLDVSNDMDGTASECGKCSYLLCIMDTPSMLVAMSNTAVIRLAVWLKHQSMPEYQCVCILPAVHLDIAAGMHNTYNVC